MSQSVKWGKFSSPTFVLPKFNFRTVLCFTLWRVAQFQTSDKLLAHSRMTRLSGPTRENWRDYSIKCCENWTKLSLSILRPLWNLRVLMPTWMTCEILRQYWYVKLVFADISSQSITYSVGGYGSAHRMSQLLLHS